MRLVIDVQGAQTASRFRGIGRYTVDLVRAMIRNRGQHEIIVVFSELLPDSIEHVLVSFGDILPREKIVGWRSPGPVSHQNFIRRTVAEFTREAFIESMAPDVVLITSLFEGYGDNAVCSIKSIDKTTPTAVILYDLIPLLNQSQYLDVSSDYKNYYLSKIDSLKMADLCLAISDYSRSEAIGALGLPSDRVVSISAAAGAGFGGEVALLESGSDLLDRFGVGKKFILYIGGSDSRKNLHRLIEAYAGLPVGVRSEHQLVFGGAMPLDHIISFKSMAASLGLSDGEFVVLGNIKDSDLIALYRSCWLFVFPSLHEGFGLPPLEAMACGAPVIASNTTSLPEVIDMPEALFDPYDVQAIREKMFEALTDMRFRGLLVSNGSRQAGRFSWDKTALRAIQSLQILHENRTTSEGSVEGLYRRLLNTSVCMLNDADQSELMCLAECWASNESVVSKLRETYGKF